jgi:trigger factor
LQTANNGLAEEEIAASYLEYAKGLRWQLLAAKIGKENGLAVTTEEVTEEARRLSSRSLEAREPEGAFSESDVEQLAQHFLQKNEGENFGRLYDQLYTNKLFNLIKEKITVITKELTVTEFQNR